MALVASAEPVGRANMTRESDMAAAEHVHVAPTIAALDASEDWAIVLGLDGAILATNASGRRVLGADGFERFQAKDWLSLWQTSDHPAAKEALALARCGRTAKFLAERRDLNGPAIWWEVALWPVCDAADRASHLLAVARDVTERRIKDEVHALLARELSHRIKNMFAVVDGVIAISSRVDAAARPFADALRARLRGVGRAMAYVAPPMQASSEEGEPRERSLQGLLRTLLQPYGGASSKDQRIFISGDDVAINLGAITPLALVTNELATNAIKYGALSSAYGRVDLNVRIEAQALRMDWRETLGEGGSQDGPAHRGDGAGEPGFGTALLDNAVVRQLNGALTREWSEQGLTVLLEFPLARIASDDG